MYLIFLISILSFLIAFSNKIIVPIQKILLMDTKKVRDMKDELRNLKKQLKQVSMKENYVEYVKIERKATNLEFEIQQNALDPTSMQSYIIKYGLSYGFKAIVGLILFLVTVFNRSEAVIVFSERFNFAPFSGIISFPSKLENSISLPFWVFINNYVFRQLAGSLK